MKTKKRIEVTWVAVASFALATAVPVFAGEASKNSTAIRPFQVHVPQTKLTDLRRRINATV